MSKDDRSVEEATAALKGMLGLGTMTEVSTPSKATTASEPSTPSQQQEQQERGSQKKKKPNQSRKKKPPTPANFKSPKSTKSKAPPEQNYAWSAFQSSPDASKLPIPAFSPAETKTVTSVEPQESIVSLLPSMDKVAQEQQPNLEDLPSAAEMEEKLLAQAASAAPTTVAPTTTVDTSPSVAPVSSTGINLAAKIKSGSPQATNVPLPPPPPQAPLPPPHFSQPYMVLQVQVPHGLPPHPHLRTMVVQTPMGYPVSVTVPPGVPPGAILPVSVPTQMMPPPPPVSAQPQG